ncbi:hypothetical protein [Aquincola tertiaricarbonis]|uniref:hypothetical protein n=1 Tax=Aquincola tertiaricarbonis TaxID=391953 RepID=UPI000615050D|nr:hypothetical protein [Aquincola tertiaricarbonis]
MGADLNPVERRLMQLADQWQAFRAMPQARLLMWQLPESGLRLAECFVEAQKLELPYATGDVFLLFKQPFVHGLQYGRALKQALRGIYDASADELRAQGMATDWPYDPAATPDTAAWFAEALRSFGSRHHQAMAPGAQLCIVLMPTAVAHAASFARWVRELLDVGLPQRLRVLMADAQEVPRFAALLAAADDRVQVQRIDIDGLALAQETFAQEGGVGPAAVFRNLMMGVVALLAHGGADQVKAKAVDALQFARQQGWADQEVALRVMVAGALLKEGRHAEAVTVYRAARQAADDTVAARHPCGHKLVLQTCFGEAAVHLATGDDAQAMRCYDEAAQVAQHDANPILAIEAFRMAAFCAARAGDRPGAQERGHCVLQLGQALKPEARGLTTLAVALVDQMRWIDPPRVQAMQQAKRWLQQQLEQVRERADALALALTDCRRPDALAQVEGLRATQAEAAAAAARQQIDGLVSQGPAPMQQWAAHGRRLLGEAWLVDSDLALPPPFEPSTGPLP